MGDGSGMRNSPEGSRTTVSSHRQTPWVRGQGFSEVIGQQVNQNTGETTSRVYIRVGVGFKNGPFWDPDVLVWYL